VEFFGGPNDAVNMWKLRAWISAACVEFICEGRDGVFACAQQNASHPPLVALVSALPHSSVGVKLGVKVAQSSATVAFSNAR
jgi:hypothetical protein